MIGGLNDNRADAKGILVLRDYPAKSVRSDGSGPPKQRMIFAIDLTSADGLFSAGEFSIQAKDVVLVAESPITSTQTIFGIVGSAVGPDAAPFRLSAKSRPSRRPPAGCAIRARPAARCAPDQRPAPSTTSAISGITACTAASRAAGPTG